MRIIRTLFLALASVLIVSSFAWASSRTELVVTPTPVQAPSETTFIVVSHSLVPTVIDLKITGQKTVHVALKKAAAHEYAGSYLLRTTGEMTATALTRSGQVLITRQYHVTKAPSHLFSKIVVAIVFFGVSIYYWRKSQRYARPNK
ncbi:MAG: hypothetical protein C7B44_15535 [Sulfobacillus thermosulfidooxidans]|uniref:hypothetical protein n=2 Tax=Sulfobacillus TaxID=28033 RepID=UPI000CD17BBE|nr:hypothetical protein [Sulfobacillus sp. hq2]POB09800.1 hypothetical protein CO251_12930 [Sulfobacillus sp. hq2]PSR32185.1 MAG: hypothetical protein C7B44_15535 [Sulfobacillus thermosulfidooxidans]